MYRFLRYVPKNHLSRTMGRLVHARLPAPIARRLVQWFARTYEIDVDAAEKPAHEYPSIGHFFTRDLREGLRPIEGEFVSPVDGVLRNFGAVSGGRLEQIKASADLHPRRRSPRHVSHGIERGRARRAGTHRPRTRATRSGKESAVRRGDAARLLVHPARRRGQPAPLIPRLRAG